MSLLKRLIKKYFLVKEIRSKFGILHFRRFRLIQTPWFAIYIHQICNSDMDYDLHDHPWNFSSVILEGAYHETWTRSPDFSKVFQKTHYSGDVIEHRAEDAHKIRLISEEVWTLVFTSGRERYWGYRLKDGGWVGHKEYRHLKREGRLGRC